MRQRVTSSRLVTIITETFGFGRAAALSAIFLISAVAILTGLLFFKSAPPTSIIMTSGPEVSLFRTNAEKYRIILARNHVELKVLPSQGSLQNLQRLDDRSFSVDVGLVQGGVTNATNLAKLVSLGSI